MGMQRQALAAGFLLCALLAVVLVPVVADVPDARVTVDDVTVEPETPTTDSPVTVSATIANSAGSGSPVSVNSVALVDGDEELVEVTGSGALSAGDDVEVPLTTRFDQPGEYSLELQVEAVDDAGNTTTVRRPVTVVVEQGAPALEFDSDDAVNGAVSNVTVDVSNPTEATLRNIVVTVDGNRIEGVSGRRVIPALDPGEETNETFQIRPNSSGSPELRTTVSYLTAAGTERTIERAKRLPVAQLDERVSIRVAAQAEDESENQQDDSLGIDVPGGLGAGGGGGDDSDDEPEGDVQITVANAGNAPVTAVVLEPRSGNQSLAVQPVADRIDPGEEETVPVTLDRTPVTAYTFEASYTSAGERKRVSTPLDLRPDRGSVTVTGVDVALDGEQARITGNVGNPGQGPIAGIVVSVDEAEGVDPAYPNRDFFVGQIEGDSFAPFELTATVDENATEVPLEVAYLVNGDQRTETVTLPVDDVERETEESGLTPGWLVPGVGAVLVLGGVSLLYFRRR